MMLLGVCGLPCLLRCQADHYPRQVRDRRDWLPLLCPRLGSGEQGLEESWSQDPNAHLWLVQAVFLETGLLACVVVVIVAQLMPQIVASLYPVQFLELVVMRPAYYACIGLELCGFTHFCWVLAAGMAKVFRMRPEGVQVQATKGRQVDGWNFFVNCDLRTQ